MKNKKILLIIFISIILCLNTMPALAEDAYKSMTIDLTLHPDGSMTYVENSDVVFDSLFTTSYLEIERKGFSSLSDFAVTVNGMPYTPLPLPDLTKSVGNFYVNDFGDPYAALENNPALKADYDVTNIPKEYCSGNYYIEWYINESESNFNYKLSYKAHDAVTLYDDIAEFYWMPLSGKMSFDIDKVLVNVHIPSGADISAVKAWAHGPLNGNVTIVSPELVTLEVDHLRRGDFVDMRLALPTELFPDILDITHLNKLENILAEEIANANDANATRHKDLFQFIFSIAIPVFFIILWILLYFRNKNRNKPHTPSLEPDYYRDLPASYSPAITYSLCTFYPKGRKLCGDEGNKISAILLDLALRKYISIDVIDKDGLFQKDETILTLRNSNLGGLNKYEIALINMLFDDISPDGKTVTMKQIKKASAQSGKQQKLIKGFEIIDAKIEEEANGYGIMGEPSKNGIIFPVLIGVVAVIIGIFCLFIDIPAIAISLMISGFIFTILTVLTNFDRLTQKGEDEYALWLAFRRFLKDFSLMDEKELPELAMWEKYLVHAVSLGIAEEVIKDLPIKYPVLTTNDAQVNYYFLYYMTRNNNMNSFREINSFGEIMHQARTIASSTQNMSSGSGSGGGFSSGGGGGGGGGSHGAR